MWYNGPLTVSANTDSLPSANWLKNFTSALSPNQTFSRIWAGILLFPPSSCGYWTDIINRHRETIYQYIYYPVLFGINIYYKCMPCLQTVCLPSWKLSEVGHSVYHCNHGKREPDGQGFCGRPLFCLPEASRLLYLADCSAAGWQKDKKTMKTT